MQVSGDLLKWDGGYSGTLSQMIKASYNALLVTITHWKHMLNTSQVIHSIQYESSSYLRTC